VGLHHSLLVPLTKSSDNSLETVAHWGNPDVVDATADAFGRSSNDFGGLSDATCPAPTEIDEDPPRVK
jgi:hypothetical protein